MSEFEIKKLSDVVELVIDNRGRNPKSYEDKGIPVIDNYLITSDGEVDVGAAKRYINDATYNSFLRKYVQKNDVLMTLVGNGYGKVAITPKEKCAIIQNTIGLRCNKQNNNQFLYYLLRNNRGALMNLNRGAAQPSIKVGDILDLEFEFPILGVQNLIANILGSIDIKISLNSQTNKTLEAIAQAIFKSWFVDFDPVKAKISVLESGGSAADAELAAMSVISSKNLTELAEFKQSNAEEYKKLAQTAALFPSAMQESELGEIPEGWALSEIGKEVVVLGGGTPSTKSPEFWEDGDVFWSTPKDMSNLKSKVLLETGRKITQAGLKKISSGLLPVNTVLMSSRAPVGYLALAKIPVAINQGYIAMKCENILSPEFVLLWCEQNMDEIKQRASGTTFAEISKSNFKPIAIVVPCKQVVENFTNKISELYTLIANNSQQSITLEKMRDSLLPRLLSGELINKDVNEV